MIYGGPQLGRREDVTLHPTLHCLYWPSCSGQWPARLPVVNWHTQTLTRDPSEASGHRAANVHPEDVYQTQHPSQMELSNFRLQNVVQIRQMGTCVVCIFFLRENIEQALDHLKQPSVAALCRHSCRRRKVFATK